MGNRFELVACFLAVRRRQMSFRLFESGLGLGADALTMLGDVVGDLTQSGVRDGQRLPQRTVAPFNAHLPVVRVDPPRGAPAPVRAIEQKNYHDYDHGDGDADSDRQPGSL